MALVDRRPILIVEDDRKVGSLIELYLHREGFSTLRAFDGRSALKLAEQQPLLFVILDLMLPRLDGTEVCRELRRHSNVPILMLTARHDEMDRVGGLSLGADDYVVKPFSPRELMARVKAILRRTQPGTAAPRIFSCGDVSFDLEKRRVFRNGEAVALTASEFVLLEALLSAPGRIFTRQELLERLYRNGEAVVERVVDVHLGRLRQKIEADASKPRLILTARGLGYHFSDAIKAAP